jgi:hypothetical protein
VASKEDWYSVLGVGANADLRTIKAAYRQRAWDCHPDRTGGVEANAAFQRLSEAYTVLSSADRRAAYDRARQTRSPPVRSSELGPIRCSECGKVTAQPRLLVFQQVRSFLFWSGTVRVEGVFCAPCARRSALQASLVSGLAGWWSVPWGPSLTVSAILANARGGLRHAETDQRLVLLNSRAFMARDRALLAYALAQQVGASASGAIGAEANRLAAQLKAQGLPAFIPPLKDPWALRRSDLATHAAIACGAPFALLLAGLVWLAN